MKRSDLKTGMLIEFQNKRFSVVVEMDNQIILQNFSGGWDKLNSYVDENLNSKLGKDYEIVAIYAQQPYHFSTIWQNDFRESNFRQVFLKQKIYDKNLVDLLSIIDRNFINVQDEDGKFVSVEDFLGELIGNESRMERFIECLREAVSK